jgi:hypothetical protein
MLRGRLFAMLPRWRLVDSLATSMSVQDQAHAHCAHDEYITDGRNGGTLSLAAAAFGPLGAPAGTAGGPPDARRCTLESGASTASALFCFMGAGMSPPSLVLFYVNFSTFNFSIFRENIDES